ncbi:hypothetical protein GCM10009606_26130 [Nocardioides aquiterrae]|uniref:CAP domain-containing protein n=1 Tax=Nocardioides aquiterrae TaxID=203799 RepID=A0ABN1UF16_9ACTN
MLVPGVLALLPEYAGLEDPVAELRAACLDAVGWLGADVTVLAGPQGRKVAESLLGSRQARPTAESLLGSRQARPTAESLLGSRQARPTEVEARPTRVDGASYLVVGNGSARRRDTSPGYVDERAIPFDADLGTRLRTGELSGIDASLARELWADTEAIARLDGVLPPGCACTVNYEDDPYGVQYWVVRWEW